MKNFLGVGMIVAGVVLGVYVGLWVCLVGGIADIVNGYNYGMVGLTLWGAAKFFLAGISGYGSAALLVLPGAAMID
jgi:hypothetical protein